jgi:hypothetical protein
MKNDTAQQQSPKNNRGRGGGGGEGSLAVGLATFREGKEGTKFLTTDFEEFTDGKGYGAERQNHGPGRIIRRRAKEL